MQSRRCCSSQSHHGTKATPKNVNEDRVFREGGANPTVPTTLKPCGGETETRPPLVAVKRPDTGGREGSPTELVANHFLVQFEPCLQIYQYDVEIVPQPSKEIARDLKRKLIQEHAHMLSDSLPAYDGRKSLYSAARFPNDHMEFHLCLDRGVAGDDGDIVKRKTYRVMIKMASTLNGELLQQFLQSKDEHVSLPQNFIQALDVVLRENPTEKCFPVSRSLYSGSAAEDIGGGAVGLQGFFQSLRATQQGLALNVDFSVTAFHQSTGVVPYLRKRCPFLHDLCNNKARKLSDGERRDVEKALRNIKVFVCHRATNQRYRIHGLTEDDTDVLAFKYVDGKPIKVVEYFTKHYNHSIQYLKLPCLQVSQSRPCYLPMELCVVCEGQRFMGKLSDEQKNRILSLGCRKPSERRNIIKDVVGGAHGPTSGNYVKQFRMCISQEMTRLSGRVLQPPKLRLGEGGEVKSLTPAGADRRWNLLRSHVADAKPLARWALVSFGDDPKLQRRSVETLVDRLPERCRQLGISMARRPLCPPRFEPMRIMDDPAALENCLRSVCKNARCSGGSSLGLELELLICVMQRKHPGYADLKRICETDIGVVTQCCLSSNLSRPSSQYLANLALKMNAKLGGTTAALYTPLPAELPALFSADEAAMFLGADVTHPHPLDDSSPSVAAVVASMSWPCPSRYAARMRSQAHRKEIIGCLREMAAELLREFRDELRQLPRRILFFRDGVSEGQFYRVLHEELRALKDACNSVAPGYCPAITFTVVQKRHHTRLFPQQKQKQKQKQNLQADHHKKIPPGMVQKRHYTRLFPQKLPQNLRGEDEHDIIPPPGTVQKRLFPQQQVSQNLRRLQEEDEEEADHNIPAGTVVDTKITHPREFDFYLCTHSGSKGTSRPTHYHVLWDENRFRSDELQKLINNLCYTFARCTKPVSLVPPAYYAHLAAYRARLYLDGSAAARNKSPCHNRICPPETTPLPLPHLAERVKKLMFYC